MTKEHLHKIIHTPNLKKAKTKTQALQEELEAFTITHLKDQLSQKEQNLSWIKDMTSLQGSICKNYPRIIKSVISEQQCEIQKLQEENRALKEEMSTYLTS